MLSTHRRHQLRGPSPAAVCHCSADTLLLAAKFLSSVALQCPWILNGEVLCFSNSCCSQIGNVAVAGCGVRGGAYLLEVQLKLGQTLSLLLTCRVHQHLPDLSAFGDASWELPHAPRELPRGPCYRLPAAAGLVAPDLGGAAEFRLESAVRSIGAGPQCSPLRHANSKQLCLSQLQRLCEELSLWSDSVLSHQMALGSLTLPLV